MFKVGDIVEITKESSATGMLDFKDGKGYVVKQVQGSLVCLKNEGYTQDWYHYSHFKLKDKEEKESGNIV